MYVSPSTPAKSIREHLEQASVAVENLCAAHATEVEKLKALSSIGTFTKNFAFIAAPTISVSKREDNRFFTSRVYISLSYKTKEGWSTTESLEFAPTPEGVNLALDKVRSIWAEGEKAHAANLAANDENVRIFNRVLDLINACGFDTKEEKYNSRKRTSEKVPAAWSESLHLCFPRYVHVSFDFNAHLAKLTATMNEIVKAVAEKKAKEDAERKAKTLADPLIPEAVAYLTQRGKTLGTDYTLETAVSTANDIAREEYIAPLKGIMNEFSGSDSCEGCSGWDGESPRCQCGSRRVGWVADYSHSFKNPLVYAEAH